VWYSLIEFHRASLESLRLAIRASGKLLKHPFNPAAYTVIGHSYSAACEAMDDAIGSYDPEAGIIELAEMRDRMASRFYSAPTAEAKILPFTRPGRLAS
jgi:poly-beta-hydroxyalkanoate depolymerase